MISADPLRAYTYILLGCGLVVLVIAALVRTSSARLHSRFDTYFLISGVLFMIASLVFAIFDSANWHFY